MKLFEWLKKHISIGKDKKTFGSRESDHPADGAFIKFKIKF